MMMKEFLLNTGSTIDEGRLAKGGSKLTGDYTQECAVCKMNPGDFRNLGSPERVKITSKDGRYSVATFARPAESMRSGQVFMPRAIWSNVVVDPETFSTGSPLYKGSPVQIIATNEDVLSAEELVQRLYMRR
ncbi:Molybdenum-containing formylmethanofuran dehydrogenase 1 subunit C [uncultured archaeon]|nr:Molybdenum-containing formylmethanofuran dehydrogenase 1 subunit C [uncultured archaeon]